MRAWHLVCLANCPPPDEVGAVECDNRLGPAAHLPVVVEVSTQLGTLPVADCCSTPDQRDLTGRKVGRFALWGPPLIAFVAGSVVGPILRTVLWTATLSVAGTACLVNAARCGRLHCYFTGPFLLLGAVVTLTYGLGVLPLGPDRWGSIGLVVAAGSCFLGCVPEWIWVKYVTRAGPAGG